MGILANCSKTNKTKNIEKVRKKPRFLPQLPL